MELFPWFALAHTQKLKICAQSIAYIDKSLGLHFADIYTKPLHLSKTECVFAFSNTDTLWPTDRKLY